MPDQTGKQIGRYETLEEIGRGGFAVVYKARDPSLDRIVALKVLAPHLLWDASFAERFQAEFETVTRLRHPNIVSVYEYAEADGQPYIAMEYLPGVTLEQLLREVGGPLPLDRVLNLVQQLATALTYALRRGVVHRDVKPRNVMVGAADRVKLTDFGIAKVAARTFQTTTGRIFGSPEYMSPEQAQGEELDHRSDVYSLGVVLYEMVTGRVPFSSDTPLSVMLGHCERQPPPPSELNPGLPAPVEAVVLKALAKSRDDRFQSASELAHNLRRAVEGKSLILETPLSTGREPAPPSLTSAPATRKPARRFNWACLGTILGIIPALVVVFVLLRPLWEIFISYITESTPTAQALAPTYTPSLTPTATHTPAPTDTPLPTATRRPQPTPTERVIIVERPVTVEVLVSPPPTSTPTPPPPTLGAGATQGWEKDSSVMVYVPAGVFLMGSDDSDPDALSSDEKPQHEVYLDAFWIDRTEVTNAQYQRCVDDGACSLPSCTGMSMRQSYYDNPEFDDYPVVCVDWDQANDYCTWAGKRLPTEAEWEKAARGTHGRLYPWGDAFDGTLLNYCDINCSSPANGEKANDGYAGVAPVGSYPAGASPYGALDMAGNVSEWVADWYDGNYYADSPDNNPKGPSLGTMRVVRSGSSANSRKHTRSANRNRNSPSAANPIQGFRCVHSATGP